MAYAGIEAKISLGTIGIMTDVAPDQVNPAALVDATNVTFFNGKVQKAPGSLLWNATPVDSGFVAVHYWEPDTVTYRMIGVTNTGNYYKGQDRIFSQIGSGLGVLTPACVFAEGGQETGNRAKKLFLFTGAGLPQVLTGDGTSVHAISRPASDWTGSNFPSFGVVHRNQLWAFSGQISYASNSQDHEDFNSNPGGGIPLVNPVFPGEGGNLLGAFDFKGVLFCFKDGGFVYQLVDTDPSETNWYWKKVASTFGLSAPNGVTEVNDDMIAGNNTGTITSYASSLRLGGIEAADMVQQALFKSYFRGYVNLSGVRYQHLLHYPEKSMVFATYQNGYFTYNNTLLCMDYGLTAGGQGGQWRPSFWTKGTPQCLALYKDVNRIRRPMYGDNSGYLNLMDQVDRSEGGAAYTGSFQTIPTDFSWLDMSFSTKEKHFDWLAVHYIPTGNWNLSCDYFVDGRYVDTIQFPMQQYLRPQLGTLKLGSDRLGQFVPEETGVRKIYGSGRTFSARFYNAGNNQNFQVSAITVGWRPGSEKAMNV